MTEPSKIHQVQLDKVYTNTLFLRRVAANFAGDPNNDIVDNHLYVVVHSSSTYLSLDDLQMNFICKFVLGDVNNCMYIIQVDDIVCPLFVFKNYGGEGKKAKDLFCALPQPNWGQYFENKIASHNVN